jgi:hypothetical protein
VVLGLLPQALHQAGRVVELVPEREVPAVHLALAGEVAAISSSSNTRPLRLPTTKAVDTCTRGTVEVPAELDRVANAVGVDLQPHLERWVEGDEPGAVDDDVDLAGEHLELRVGEPEERVGDVPVQDPAPLEDERPPPPRRRGGRAAAGRARSGPPSPRSGRRRWWTSRGARAPRPAQHLPVAVEEHGEGHLAQKSGAAGQENALAGEGIGHGEHGRFHRVVGADYHQRRPRGEARNAASRRRTTGRASDIPGGRIRSRGEAMPA